MKRMRVITNSRPLEISPRLHCLPDKRNPPVRLITTPSSSWLLPPFFSFLPNHQRQNGENVHIHPLTIPGKKPPRNPTSNKLPTGWHWLDTHFNRLAFINRRPINKPNQFRETSNYFHFSLPAPKQKKRDDGQSENGANDSVNTAQSTKFQNDKNCHDWSGSNQQTLNGHRTVCKVQRALQHAPSLRLGLIINPTPSPPPPPLGFHMMEKGGGGGNNK